MGADSAVWLPSGRCEPAERERARRNPQSNGCCYGRGRIELPIARPEIEGAARRKHVETDCSLVARVLYLV